VTAALDSVIFNPDRFFNPTTRFTIVLRRFADSGADSTGLAFGVSVDPFSMLMIVATARQVREGKDLARGASSGGVIVTHLFDGLHRDCLFWPWTPSLKAVNERLHVLFMRGGTCCFFALRVPVVRAFSAAFSRMIVITLIIRELRSSSAGCTNGAVQQTTRG